MKVKLRPEARLDIFQASRFYDRQSDGWGDKFVESIYDDLERMETLHDLLRHSRRRYFGSCRFEL